MKGIVLASVDGRRFVCVPSGTAADFDTERDGGGWRACLSLRDSAGGMFGPIFDTEAEALALARSAAVALAHGTGGVFGEVRPLKVGDRVKCAEEGLNFGDEGVVINAHDKGFRVRWDDGDDDSDCEWGYIGVYVSKADAPVPVEPVKPSGPTPGMRVKIIDPNDADFGDEGKVYRVYEDGAFSVDWDDGKWSAFRTADFGKQIGPA